MTGLVPVIHVGARSARRRFAAPIRPGPVALPPGAAFPDVDMDGRDEAGHDGEGAAFDPTLGITLSLEKSRNGVIRLGRNEGRLAASRVFLVVMETDRGWRLPTRAKTKPSLLADGLDRGGGQAGLGRDHGEEIARASHVGVSVDFPKILLSRPESERAGKRSRQLRRRHIDA